MIAGMRKTWPQSVKPVTTGLDEKEQNVASGNREKIEIEKTESPFFPYLTLSFFSAGNSRPDCS